MDLKDYSLDKTIRLKMNKAPIIKSYLHHATINAIISGTIEESSEVSMELEFCGKDTHSWSENPHITASSKTIVMKEEGAGNYEFLYRKCEEIDEIAVYINTLKNKNANSVLNFVITSGDFGNNIRRNSKTYKFGIMDGHIITRLEEKFYVHTKFDDEKYKYVKLHRNRNHVCSYISENGYEWILIEELEVGFLDENCSIGLIAEEIRPDDIKNEYYKWLYMNYIQMYLNPNDLGGLFIDYSMFPTKSCRYEYAYASNFLDIDYLEIDDVVDVFGDMISFINWCLRRGYYPAVTMDEYFIKGRRSYLSDHFFHHNVVYGYDAESCKYSLMSYDLYLTNDEVEAEEVKKALHKPQGIIMLYKLKKSGWDYSLSLPYLIHEFEDLLKGGITNESSGSIIQQTGVYGLNVINKLCDTEYGKWLILQDQRTSYFLYEHCMIMKRRLDYLKKEFEFISFDELDEACISMVICSETIKNLVLKNQIKNCYEERIISLLRNLHNEEVSFYTRLVDKLKEGIQNDFTGEYSNNYLYG